MERTRGAATVQVTALWGVDVVATWRVATRQGFRVGEQPGCDFVAPGAEALAIVEPSEGWSAGQGTTSAYRDGGGHRPDHVQVGDLTFVVEELASERWEAVPARTVPWLLVAIVSSGLAHGLLCFFAARAEQPNEDERFTNQVREMHVYVQRSDERTPYDPAWVDRNCVEPEEEDTPMCREAIDAGAHPAPPPVPHRLDYWQDPPRPRPPDYQAGMLRVFGPTVLDEFLMRERPGNLSRFERASELT